MKRLGLPQLSFYHPSFWDPFKGMKLISLGNLDRRTRQFLDSFCESYACLFGMTAHFAICSISITA